MCPGLTDPQVADLRAALELAMEFRPPRFEAEFDALDRETHKLRGWLGGQGSVKPPQDVSHSALREFVRAQELPTLRHATAASFGCTDPFDGRAHGLIADGELFPVFLDRLDDYRESPRAFRLCYRGLLHSYFQYDVQRGPRPAHDNWRLLRTYLNDRSVLIGTPGFQPTWIGTLERNPEVLGQDPGSFYGEELFRGRPERFDEVCKELAITDASWLIWHVVVGQIEAATLGADSEFRASIPELLKLLEKHLLAKNLGLAKLLTRYRECGSPTLHEQLRDFAVGAWGNPWLAMNEASWSVVASDARQMVADWLKLALMQKFFGLLADDGLNDTRRLKFWESYHQSIHAMYFALGETARTHRGPDFREVRKQMEGLRLALTHSTSKNNAFIMHIGEHVVVEFGEKGNACYIFHKDRLPFELAGEVAGNYLALKHDDHVTRLRHADSGTWKWEENFHTALANVVRVERPSASIKPSGSRDPQQSRATVLGPHSAFPSGHPVRSLIYKAPQAPERDNADASDTRPGKMHHRYAPQSKTPFTMEEFEQFCRSNYLQWRDFRPMGGTLKVLTKTKGTKTAAQLTAWGFQFKDSVGWWFQ
jgi:hypothetical protein